MNSQLFSSSPCFSLLCFLLVILLKIQSSLSNPYLESLSCLTKFECGNITADYPFWGRHRQEHCGHPEFELHCEYDDVTTMMISDVKYMVLSINSASQTLRIAISMLQSFHKVCLDFPNSTSNTTFNSELFNYSGAYENVTLHYGCQGPSSFDDPKEGCQVNGVKYKGESIPAEGPKHGPGGCQPNATVPVPKPLPGAKANWADWEEALKQGFELKWKIEGVVCEKCTNSKGICWFNSTFSETRCYCPHTTQLFFNEPCPYKPPQAPPVEK